MKKMLVLLIIAVILLPSDSAAASEFPRIASLISNAYETPPRYYAEYVSGFIPSDEYGKVYPYLGAMYQYSYASDERFFAESEPSPLYGFINAEGSVVCEPVYNSVVLLTNGRDNMYAVTRRETENAAVSAIISESGALYMEFDDICTYTYALSRTFEYIPVKRGGKWGVIDYEGNLPLPCIYPNPPVFSHGLAAVFHEADYKHLYEYIENGVPYYYIDIEGCKQIDTGLLYNVPDYYFYGGEEPALDYVVFENGLARFFTYDNIGFIDTLGNIVYPAVFDIVIAQWNSEGLMLLRERDTSSSSDHSNAVDVLIDNAGNRVLETSDTLYEQFGAYAVYSSSETNKVAEMYDLGGNKLPVYGDTYMGNGWFRSALEDGGVMIAGNGASHNLHGAVYTYHIYGDWFIVHYEQTDTDKLWNARTGEFLQGDYTSVTYYNDVLRIYKTGENGINLFGILNKDMGTIIDMEYDRIEPIGEYFMVKQGNLGGLLNDKGEWIIKTRLIQNYD